MVCCVCVVCECMCFECCVSFRISVSVCCFAVHVIRDLLNSTPQVVGFSVRGRVADAKGEPVADVKISLGHGAARCVCVVCVVWRAACALRRMPFAVCVVCRVV